MTPIFLGPDLINLQNVAIVRYCSGERCALVTDTRGVRRMLPGPVSKKQWASFILSVRGTRLALVQPVAILNVDMITAIEDPTRSGSREMTVSLLGCSDFVVSLNTAAEASECFSSFVTRVSALSIVPR